MLTPGPDSTNRFRSKFCFNYQHVISSKPISEFQGNSFEPVGGTGPWGYFIKSLHLSHPNFMVTIRLLLTHEYWLFNCSRRGV